MFGWSLPVQRKLWSSISKEALDKETYFLGLFFIIYMERVNMAMVDVVDHLLFDDVVAGEKCVIV